MAVAAATRCSGPPTVAGPFEFALRLVPCFNGGSFEAGKKQIPHPVQEANGIRNDTRLGVLALGLGGPVAHDYKGGNRSC